MAIALVFVAIVFFLLYKFSVRNFDYWEKKDVPFLRPVPFFGNFLEVFLGRINIGFCLAKCYNQFSTPYFGIYILNRPFLVLRSPDLIKRILVQDFNYFCNHTAVANQEADPIGANVLYLSNNPQWKLMRSKIAPAYSTGRVKKMLPLVNEVADNMKKYINKQGYEFCMDAKTIGLKYGVDVLASLGCGVNGNCFKSDHSQFEIIAKKIFNSRGITAFRKMCSFLVPSLVQLFRMPLFDSSVTNFMREITSSVTKDREGKPHIRNDMIDIIIEIKNNSSTEDPFKFDKDIATSQAFQFYATGLETSSNTFAFILYEFCINPNIQDRVRCEIKNVISQHGGFTYEAVQDMKYIDMVVSESFRKYAAFPFLDRMCMEDYKVPGSNLVIEKGTPVYIPMFGLHYDPEYFPKPNEFIPERFSEENKVKLPSGSYLPFGEGPRACLGQRIGILMTKLGIAHLMSEITVESSWETPIPMKFDPMGFMLSSTVGLPMKFKKCPLFKS